MKLSAQSFKYQLLKFIKNPHKLHLIAELVIIIGLFFSSIILLLVTTSAYALMMLIAALAFTLSYLINILQKKNEIKVVLFFGGWLIFYAFLLVLTLLVFNWLQEKNFGGYPLSFNNFVWWYQFALIISLIILLWKKMQNSEFMFFGLTGAMISSPLMIPLKNWGWNLWQEQRIILFYFPIGLVSLIIALIFKEKLKKACKDFNYCFKGILLTALIICLTLMAFSAKSAPPANSFPSFHSAPDKEKVLGKSIIKTDYPARLKLKQKKTLQIKF